LTETPKYGWIGATLIYRQTVAIDVSTDSKNGWFYTIPPAGFLPEATEERARELPKQEKLILWYLLIHRREIMAYQRKNLGLCERQ
jgi:hypothetical protein